MNRLEQAFEGRNMNLSDRKRVTGYTRVLYEAVLNDFGNCCKPIRFKSNLNIHIPLQVFLDTFIHSFHGLKGLLCSSSERARTYDRRCRIPDVSAGPLSNLFVPLLRCDSERMTGLQNDRKMQCCLLYSWLWAVARNVLRILSSAGTRPFTTYFWCPFLDIRSGIDLVIWSLILISTTLKFIEKKPRGWSLTFVTPANWMKGNLPSLTRP